jgi:hypothetical protein
MKPDPIINGRLLELQENARALGVNFRVIEQEATVPFPQDHMIRKEWRRGSRGRII